MNLKRIILISSLVITLLICGWFTYYPQKIAINKNALDEMKREYVICEPCLVTGFEWQIVESSTGYNGYVFIEGELSNVHEVIRTEITSNNKFVLYGKFIGERDFHNEGMFPVFQSDSWDVLAPINRGTAIPNLLSPSYGLTWLDFHHR